MSAERLYYDGDCGLCHRAVRFVLRRQPGAEGLRFAPLGGATFHRRVAAERRAELPDSLVLETADGRLLTRSAGVLHLLSRLGGPWAWAGRILRLVPTSLGDAAYDLIARHRRRLAPPAAGCPVAPEARRGRFDP